MTLSKIASIVLSSLMLCACAGSQPASDNQIQAAARKLVGQPASKAFEIFGQPDHGMGPSSYGSGGFYAWNRIQTHTTPEQVFIKTGSEYVGEQQTWVGTGGGGAVGLMPIGSQPVYRDTGYYENKTVLDYYCNITLFTDARDIITSADVINCNEKK